jgi:hypothetical protein
MFHLRVKSGACHISCDKIEDTVINSKILVTCYEIESCNSCSTISVGKRSLLINIFASDLKNLISVCLVFEEGT